MRLVRICMQFLTLIQLIVTHNIEIIKNKVSVNSPLLVWEAAVVALALNKRRSKVFGDTQWWFRKWGESYLVSHRAREAHSYLVFFIREESVRTCWKVFCHFYICSNSFLSLHPKLSFMLTIKSNFVQVQTLLWWNRKAGEEMKKNIISN